jgi:hypothetical protein
MTGVLTRAGRATSDWVPRGATASAAGGEVMEETGGTGGTTGGSEVDAIPILGGSERDMNLVPLTYKYDVFLSYSRRAGAGAWVQKHFYPALADSLAHAMPRDPIIFTDWRQETGISWPDNLAAALQESRVMVAILSPPYFRSTWCMTEWGTMQRRQELLRLGTPINPRVLTHPVVFADGEHFPSEARRIQHIDLSEWGYDLPYETYSRCPGYLDFLRAVRSFAQVLAHCIDDVPEWQADWPIVEAKPLPEARADLPRLWGSIR